MSVKVTSLEKKRMIFSTSPWTYTSIRASFRVLRSFSMSVEAILDGRVRVRSEGLVGSWREQVDEG